MQRTSYYRILTNTFACHILVAKTYSPLLEFILTPQILASSAIEADSGTFFINKVIYKLIQETSFSHTFIA